MAQYSSVPFADPPWHRIDVRNPAYKESHKRLQEFMRSYVDQHIRPFAQEWEENGEVPKDVCLVSRCSLQMHTIPEPHSTNLLSIYFVGHSTARGYGTISSDL